MSRCLSANFIINSDGVVKRKNPVNLRGPMSSLRQDRPPFAPTGFFNRGFRVKDGDGANILNGSNHCNPISRAGLIDAT
jgi:hypothetical protein